MPATDHPNAESMLDEETPADVLSRRGFVHRLTFMGGGVVLLGGACTKEPAPAPALASAAPLTTKHQTFTDEEFAVVAAAAERVLPKDEDVGALDTNVPDYIDRVLQTPQLTQMKDQFVPGVSALNRRCQRQFKVDFAKATPAQQDELLTAFKNSGERTGESKFYEILVVLTLEGYLGDPSYGGNTNRAGWGVVGFSLVQHGAADPAGGYDGMKRLHELKCGGGKGC